ASQTGRESGAAPRDRRAPAPFARDALPSGCAGGSRHKPALNVSAPADIQGGDAVADERPSGVSDALSVRSYERIAISRGITIVDQALPVLRGHSRPRQQVAVSPAG